MDSAETLARQLADMKRRIQALERGTQLTTSTIGTSAGTVSVVQGIEAGMSAGAAAAEALLKASSAEAKADGAVHTYFGEGEPGVGVNIGDLWRKDDGTVLQYDGTDWVALTDPELALEVGEALDRLSHAEEALDGKVTTYFVTSTNPPPREILNVGDLWIVSDGGNLIRRWDGTDWVDAPAGSAALADRAVTSTKLETDLVLSSRLIAGDPAGTHAELTDEGFFSYGANGTQEVVRLGVKNESDYLTITKHDGSSAAGISQAGTLSALGVSAGDKFWYKGRELTEITDDMPLGVIASGVRTSNSEVVTTMREWHPFMRIDATLMPGRVYKLSAAPFHVRLANNVIGRIHIACAYNRVCTHAVGGAPEQIDQWLTSNKVRIDYDLPAPLSCLYELPSQYTAPTSVSFLLGFGPMQAGGSMQITPVVGGDFWPTYFTLEDLGKPRTISNGHAACGNVSDAFQPGPMTPQVGALGPAERAVYNVNASGVATKVTVSGASADTLFQGPDITTGQRRVSLVRFTNLPENLTGCDVKAMQLLVNAKQWFYNYGGTVRIAPHTWTSAPSSFNLNALPQLTTESAGFPNPGYRWIPIPPEWWNGFKTGQFRGFVLLGDETNDTSGVFGNAPEVDATAELPMIQVGFIPNAGVIA